MSTEMNPAQMVMVEAATAFANGHLDGIAADLDLSAVYPKELVREMAQSGLLGVLITVKHGGAALGFLTYVEIVQALSRACAAIASVLNHHSLAAAVITQWGDDRQKGLILPALANGTKLATYALGETGPAVGVGPSALIATRRGDGYSLTGTKAFVRNAGVAHTILVFATLAEPPGPGGLAAFVVPADATGIAVGPRLETMGLNGCPVAHITFTDVAVSAASMLLDATAGAAAAERLTALAALAEAAQSVGIARAASIQAAGYAAHRVQFHHPVAHLEAIQTMLADMATDTHLAWLGVKHAALLVDQKQPFEVEASMVKSFLARTGARMMVDGCQVEGGLGISESAPKGIRVSLPLARLFRDMAGTTLLDAPADFPSKLIAASLV